MPDGVGQPDRRSRHPDHHLVLAAEPDPVPDAELTRLARRSASASGLGTGLSAATAGLTWAGFWTWGAAASAPTTATAGAAIPAFWTTFPV